MVRSLKNLVPQSVKNAYHLLLAVLANIWFGFSGKKIKVIGVTGTNGKTTTVQFIAAMLEEMGYKVAKASTIDFQIGEKRWVNATKFTTLSSWAIQKFLREAVRAGCDYVVLETSSHALDQYRVWGIPYEVAVMTNVTREHLDYHKTMPAYRAAKKKLFDQAKVAVINADMENPDEFACAMPQHCILYSMRDPQANVLAQHVTLGLEQSNFEVESQTFELSLPGQFNVENALAAIAAGLSQNITLPVMAQALSKVKRVPGRMETVPNKRGLKIMIDYAVTPDSLEKLYALVSGMKPTPQSKIIAVLGACGERDRGKRPIMGEIVSGYADIIILTNEDPYHEDPLKIMAEIEAGIHGKKKEENLFVILDRRAAIRQALELVQPGDTLVITGKGAEETMAIGSKRIPWNDRKVIEEELEKLNQRNISPST